MNASISQRRFRLSIRTLMIAVALCALLLAPAVWMFRRTEELLRRERMAAELARAQAERALYLAQVQSVRAVLNAPKTGSASQLKMGPQAADRPRNLWAAVSVNHAVFKQGQTKDLSVEFTLVNDGAKVIDPKIAESRILINGAELSVSGSILSQGLKDAQVKALSPGANLQFGVVLGDHFTAPGTYRVSWKGTGFQSPETVIRVLPEKAR